MPFIGVDGLPEWRVTLSLATDTRPVASPLWVRDSGGVDIGLSATGLLSGAWIVSGSDVNLLNPPGGDAVWAVLGSDVNLIAS